MEFIDVLQKRRSIRSFSSKPVESEKLTAILQAANLAPSAGNLQAYEIYVVTNPSQRTTLARAALSQDFIADAPVNLVFCAHPARSQVRYRDRGVRLYCIQDATIATTFAMLTVTSLGLGSVWVGAFDEDSVREVIGVDRPILPVAILAIGYADEVPPSMPRRELTDIVHRL